MRLLGGVLVAVLVACVSCCMCFAQQTTQSPLGYLSAKTGLLLTDHTTVSLIQNSSGDIAHQYDVRLSNWSRIEASPAYDQAAAWLVAQAKENGLKQVKIENFRSDGKATYLGYRTKLHWKPTMAELWMKSPYETKITSFAELPNSLCRGSVNADVEAELVDIGSGMHEEDYKTSVKGKIVLTSSDPAAIVERAVHEKGAAGIVSYWTIPEWDRLNRLPGDDPNLVGWRYLPDSGDTANTTFAFMISPREAGELTAMTSSDGVIRLKAIVKADLQAGDIGVVSGVIPGSKYPDEEVLLTAHLDEIGADDNASGSASLLEMVRTLNHLIDTGQIPRPLRTIRFIWGPEYITSYAWLSRHRNDPVKRIADLNYDMVGGDLVKDHSVYQIASTPDSTPSFLNAVMASILDFMNKYNDENYPPVKEFHIISVNGSRERLQGRMVPFIAGSDHEVYDHLGIPGTYNTTWPETVYHSSKDTPDTVDPTQLHRSVFSGLAAMTTLAYADDNDAGSLARQALDYGRKRITSEVVRADKLLASSSRDNFHSNQVLANLIVSHAFEREEAAIRSCTGFSRSPATRKEIEAMASMLDGEKGPYLRELEAVGTVQTVTVEGDRGWARELTQSEREAANLIPLRSADWPLAGWGFAVTHAASSDTSEISMVNKVFEDAAQEMKRDGKDDLRVMSLADAPAFYADGKRSILDIHDAIAAEYLPMPIEVFTAYFRVFAGAGVVSLNNHSNVGSPAR